MHNYPARPRRHTGGANHARGVIMRPQDIVTPTQAAHLFGVPPSTVRSWIHRRRTQPLGRIGRYNVNDLQTLAEVERDMRYHPTAYPKTTRGEHTCPPPSQTTSAKPSSPTSRPAKLVPPPHASTASAQAPSPTSQRVPV